MRALLFTAFAASLAAADDSQTLLERASAKIVDDIHRLPNYTCVQTVSRSFSEDSNPAVVLSSCDQMVESVADREKTTLKLSWLDRLHFDVAVSEGKEIFSWAGDKRFQSERNASLADEGAIGTGDFAGFISTIFGGHKAIFEYKGQHAEGDSTVAEFAYKVPLAQSSYSLRIGTRSFIVAFHGTFWIDPATADLKRLTVSTDDPPAETEICQANTFMDYTPVKIGKSTFILPKSTELLVLGTNGSKSDNKTIYSGCRQYLGESTIHFEDIADAQPLSHVQKTISLPAGLQVDIRLKTAIDSETMMAGDAISGLLTKPLKDQSGQVLFPRDAIVHGRIVRMQKRLKPQPLFLVGLRFESVETADASAALALAPMIGKEGGHINKPGKEDLRAIEYATSKTRGDSTGEGTFLFPGDHLRIRAGSVSHWKTRQPIMPAR